jgi:hypothetical protein
MMPAEMGTATLVQRRLIGRQLDLFDAQQPAPRRLVGEAFLEGALASSSRI